MKKYIKKIKDYIEDVEKFISDNSYHTDHNGKMITINVALYNLSFSDVDDICDGIDKGKYGCKDLTEEQKEEVKEQWRDKMEYKDGGNQLDWFIECEYDYWKEVVNGCRNSSPEYWQEEILKVQRGRTTSYPHLDSVKDREERIRKIRRWQKKDKEELAMFNQVEDDDMGLYGRGGKHLCFFQISYFENTIEELDGLINEAFDAEYEFRKDYGNDYREHMRYIKDEYESLKWKMKVVRFVMSEAESMFNSLPEGWEGEIEFRTNEILEEIIDEPKAKEVVV